MQPVSVHVWSDIACPWCFLGKRRLEKGIAEYGGPVTVEYHSFELAPDTPVDFEGNEVDFLAAHKGMTPVQAQRMLAEMTHLAARDGLRYDFAALRHTRTLLAHQALHHAKAHGRQPELAEALFSAYFEQGRHLGHVDELAALAGEVGLDPDETAEALRAGTYAGAVAQDIEAARQLGVNGVPFYVIDNRYAVSGAQQHDLFADALRRAANEQVAAAGNQHAVD
jgi:predicted DsbA family dithiol-disulfide isomerase